MLPMDALTPVEDEPPVLSLDALTPLAPDALQPLPTDPSPPMAAAPPAVVRGTAVQGAVVPVAPPAEGAAPAFVVRSCPSCQAPVNEGGGAFCESCGLKLPKLKTKGVKAKKKRADDEIVKCFDCGCKNSGDRTLCRDCGMPLPRQDDN